MAHLYFDRDFGIESQRIAQQAVNIANRYRHSIIDVEHILLALLELPDVVLINVYSSIKVDPIDLHKRLSNILQHLPRSQGTELSITPEIKQLIELAAYEANRDFTHETQPYHFLLGILHIYNQSEDWRKRAAARLLTKNCLTEDVVRKVVRDVHRKMAG